MSLKKPKKYFVKKPVYKSLSKEERKSKNPAMVLLNKSLIPESDYSLTLRWVNQDLGLNPYVNPYADNHDKIISH